MSVPTAQADQVMTGGGGYWDQFTWDQFTWDAALIEQPRIAIDGTERNIGPLFYANRALGQAIHAPGCNPILHATEKREMTNPYYTATGSPMAQTRGASSHKKRIRSHSVRIRSCLCLRLRLHCRALQALRQNDDHQ